MTDIDTPSVRIPTPHEMIQAKLKAAERDRSQLRLVGRTMVIAGSLGLAAAIADYGNLPDWLSHTLIAVTIAAVIVGAGCWRTAATLRTVLDLYMAMRWEIERVTEAVNESAIGRLDALLEQNNLVLRQLKVDQERFLAEGLAFYLNGQGLNGHAAEGEDDENVVRLPTPDTIRALERFARKIVYPEN